MEKSPKGKKNTIRTNTTFDTRFLRTIEMLALANGMTRDQFLEYAVRKAFGEEIKVIEASLLKDEAESAPHTKHLIATPA